MPLECKRGSIWVYFRPILVPLTPLPVTPHPVGPQLLGPSLIPSRIGYSPPLSVNRPASITNCYAGLFARLPSLSQIYGAPHHSAQALYNFIFAPSQPLEVQPRILRHRMYPWDLPRQSTSRLLNRNQRLLGPYWIVLVSWTFPLPYVMTITTAHLLCSLVACRTRFWALLLPWLNFPPFSITSTNTLPLTYALTSALALNLALSLSSSALAPTSV